MPLLNNDVWKVEVRGQEIWRRQRCWWRFSVPQADVVLLFFH